jgi:Peptidase S24-like
MVAYTGQPLLCDLAAEVLLSSGRLQFRAKGASMLPALWPGDLVTIHSASIDQIRGGEIVLFRADRQLCLHRVVRKSRGVLITRGDSVRCDDEPVHPHDILGRLVGVQRGRSRFAPRERLTRCQEFLLLLMTQSRRLTLGLLRLHLLRLKLASL